MGGSGERFVVDYVCDKLASLIFAPPLDCSQSVCQCLSGSASKVQVQVFGCVSVGWVVGGLSKYLLM